MAPGWGGYSGLFAHDALHLARPAVLLFPYPLLTQSHTKPLPPPPHNFTTTYILPFLPDSFRLWVPTPMLQAPSTLSPLLLALSLPTYLEGRHHCVFLGVISLAVKCKDDSKIQHFLSLGMARYGSQVCGFWSQTMWIRTSALPFKRLALGGVKKHP